MRLAGRAEIRLDAEMDLQCTALEPAAATRCEVGRLGHLVYAERITVKGARGILAVGGHCELHMI
jgi:hypothetical protein